MTNSNLFKNRKDNYRNVFRSKKSPPLKSKSRLIFESILMLSTGGYLLYFLNWLPQKFAWQDLAIEAWNDFTAGIYQLLSSFLSFFVVLLVFLLVLLGFTLLIGGLWRVGRLLSRVMYYPSRRKY